MAQVSPRDRLLAQIAARGIDDRRVLEALRRVPRERFVRPEDLQSAWSDRALPIAAAQTISQPYMVALMTRELALTGEETVLEIGTGSGYQAAILAHLCRRVVTIERIAELSRTAETLLKDLGIANVEFHVGDGSLGWPPSAPYDGIIVTAGAPEWPRALYEQLRVGGRLVIPVGTGYPQMLQTITRGLDHPQVVDVCQCSFVPLIGKEGWKNGADRETDE